jgi:hypothetical protein
MLYKKYRGHNYISETAKIKRANNTYTSTIKMV